MCVGYSVKEDPALHKKKKLGSIRVSWFSKGFWGNFDEKLRQEYFIREPETLLWSLAV